MKRSLIIVFLCTYLLSVSGFGMNMHFCGGELDSVSLFWGENTGKAKCGCGSKEMKDCCKDKQMVLKVKDSHKGSAFHINFSQLFAAHIVPAIPSFELQSYITVFQRIGAVFYNGPPGPSGQGILLLNCVFRI